MKVLFVINCFSEGIGGHYHSLDHVSREIGKYIEAKIVSIGIRESPVINKNPLFIEHFSYTPQSVYLLNQKFNNLLKDFNADIVHCFDIPSAAILSILPALWNKKIVQTLCGGANSNPKLIPIVSAFTLFSKENFDWFSKSERLKETDIYLIPNRVSKITLGDNKNYIKDNNKFNFVRISRIGSYYKQSLLQAINLVKELKNELNVRLYIIGVIQDRSVFNELSSIVEKDSLPVLFITDNVTKNASELLYLADCVIGTGRGVMEAMSLGRPTLAPTRNGELPVLVDETTFDSLFKTNFSERETVNDSIFAASLDKIKVLISDKLYYNQVSDFSYNQFKCKFDISNAGPIYIEVYSKAKIKSKSKTEVINNIFQCVFHLYELHRLSKRRNQLANA